MKVRKINNAEAEMYLGQIGMRIGDWAQLTESDGLLSKRSEWVHFHAPKEAASLLSFSEHIAGWLPRGDWKLLQLDYSSNFNPIEMSMFGGLLFGCSGDFLSIDDVRTMLFEFNDDWKKNQCVELLIANLIYVLLLYEEHAHLVSSDCKAEKHLSIQDGFVYFISNKEGVRDARTLLEVYQENPTSSPQWVIDIIAASQE